MLKINKKIDIIRYYELINKTYIFIFLFSFNCYHFMYNSMFYNTFQIGSTEEGRMNKWIR